MKKRSNFSIFALAISAVLHGILFLLLLNNLPQEKSSQPLSIEIRETNSDSAGPAAQVKNLQLSDLKPKFPMASLDAEKSNDSENEMGGSGFAQSGIGSQKWGTGGNGLEGIQNHRATSKAAEKMRGLLIYPKELARNEVSGVVNARISFAQDGRCDLNKTRLSSTNFRLNETVLNMIQKFCDSNPLHGTKLIDTQHLDFSVRFDPFQERTSEPVVGGNIIFLTAAGGQMRGMVKMGPVQFNPLLIPTGMFLFADPIWIQEFFNKAKKGSAVR